MPEKPVLYFFTAIATLTIFLLVSFNLNFYLFPKKVLGASIEVNVENLKTEEVFWQGFISKNPEYLPGLIELSKIENSLRNQEKERNINLRIKQIDPNLIFTP